MPYWMVTASHIARGATVGFIVDAPTEPTAREVAGEVALGHGIDTVTEYSGIPASVRAKYVPPEDRPTTPGHSAQ